VESLGCKLGSTGLVSHGRTLETGYVSAVEKPLFTVAVRELVEFVLRRGNIGGTGEFVGADRALAGTRGHQRVQRGRPAGYRKELPVSRDVDGGEVTLRVQGRIDGVLVMDDAVMIEEIKTVRSGWDQVADPLHWAQAKIYAFIHAENEALETVGMRLIYLDLDTGELMEFEERAARAELSRFFDETVSVYVEWVRELHRWRLARDHSIGAIEFPFARFRAGQREIAVSAYRTISAGGRLFIEAPTGIGKTASVLFPAVKALGEGRIGRIFYLTARTVGRVVAEETLAGLRAAGLRFRSLTLTAREKVCVQNGQPCDLVTCPLAQGYYDRRHGAMRAALGIEGLTRTELEAVSREHQVCPFELALDVSMWVDAVICDYNYVFDPRVYLRRHFADEDGTAGFLVDEAHNLVDRAREMFSAELSSQQVRQVQREVKKALPRCAKALRRVDESLRELAGSGVGQVSSLEWTTANGELELFRTGKASQTDPDARSVEKRKRPIDLEGEELTQRELPHALMAPVESALEEMETWLAQNRPAPFRDDVLELYFRFHAFRRTAELYDERYVTLIQTGATTRVRLFCIDPSFLLRQALGRGGSAVFFSATLTPTDYYRALLGGSAEDPQMRMESPFDPERLGVLVHDRVRTEFKARGDSLPEVVEAIDALVGGRPGNYMVYFPSYRYLEDALDLFKRLHSRVNVLAQQPGMTESDRELFLAAFASDTGETRVGFAVMGGIFGEGIDLVGDRLIGAAIVGVGLPRLCVERDVICDYFEARTRSGFDYAYLFPGMNRVLQAVGRVIRSETDRGVVLLLDTRFGQQRYRRLFPAWWRVRRAASAAEIRTFVRLFWERS
jgi:DNA excision repair protein ERCC-2